MAKRGRPPKLTPEQVTLLRLQLRAKHDNPEYSVTNKELQARYKITYLTLRKVKKGLHPYEFVDEVQVSDPQ